MQQRSIENNVNLKDTVGVIIDPSTKQKQQEIINKMPILETNGGVPVNIQDQTTEVVDVFFCQTINAVTLANPIVADTYTATLVAGHGMVAGNMLCMKEGSRFFQAIVLSVATNVVTIDRPFDFSFTTSASAQRNTKEMNVDGSITRQIFRITPVGTNVKFDITKLIFHIEDNANMDASTFGGIPELTRGIILRKKDGLFKTVFNAKSNGDFGHHCQDIQFDTRATGTGQYNFRAIKRLSGQDNHGVVIRLDPALNDELQVIIQDNLTALTEFHCIALGHVVQD